MEEIRDFYEAFLKALVAHQVEHMIFGGFAVNMYGFTRVTEDLDVWINPETGNLNRFKEATLSLGFEEAPQLNDFISGESIMLRLTEEGFRVDLLTKLNIRKSFSDAFEKAVHVMMPYGKIFFIGYNDLIDEKIRAKRPKDLLDVQQLRILRGEE